MLSHDFFNFKIRKQKITLKLKDKQSRLNQNVTIRNICVYPSPIQGEFYSKRIYFGDEPFARLFLHVQSLFELANLVHKNFCYQRNANGILELLPGRLNTITRLLMPEFSLYTQKPLSLSDFEKLLELVDQAAASQVNNVHLVLSSLAVKLKNDCLLNVVLYVQCGAEPNIQFICKKNASRVDLKYKDTFLFNDNSYSFSNFENQFIGSKNLFISTLSLFTVTTAGGAQYLQGVDICLDHAKKHTQKLLKQLINAENSELIPQQIDYVITANSIEVEKENTITNSYFIIDPWYTLLKQAVINLNLNDLNAIYNSQPHTVVEQTSDKCITVKKPSFGEDYKIFVSEELPVGTFNDSDKALVEQHNQTLTNKLVRHYLQNMNNIDHCFELDDALTNLEKLLDQLQSYIVIQCSPSFLEELFNSKQRLIKLKIFKLCYSAIEEIRKNSPIEKLNQYQDGLTNLSLELTKIHHPIALLCTKEVETLLKVPLINSSFIKNTK